MACALGAGCAEESIGTDQSALISDQVHNGGTAGFYWLDPLVPAPHPTGTFEPRLAPVVVIDRINPTTRATLGNLVTYNSQTRVHGARVRVHARRGYYVVRWRTEDFDLSTAAFYRIRVLVDGRQLGFADVDVVRTRNEARNVDNNVYVPLKLDSTLAIKFRIETRAVDQDGDGVVDWRDNCPTVPNGPGAPTPPGGSHDPPVGCDNDWLECDPDESDCSGGVGGGQTDTDHDGIGDACECANVVCGPTDACHGAGTCQSTTGTCTSGASLPDGDGDGVCNAIDACPLDPRKTAPGGCGCGVADTDGDGDGTPDCHDTCPLDPTKVAAGGCGCGVADTDGDGDGTPDCHDACPADASKVAAGACGCGVADTDIDQDGTVDCQDTCPLDPAKTAPGVCGCGQVEQIGCGVCADTSDADGDGTPNCLDACRFDPFKTALGVCGCGVEDIDGDGDGIVDCLDPCPGDRNNTCPVTCVAEPLAVATVAVGAVTAITIDLLDVQIVAVEPDGTVLAIPAGGVVPVVSVLAVSFAGPFGATTPRYRFVYDTPTSVRLEVTPFTDGGYLATVEWAGQVITSACVSSPVSFEAVCVGAPDADGDGTPDCDDRCPLDPAKTVPGACGCGVADTDANGNGVPDCLD